MSRDPRPKWGEEQERKAKKWMADFQKESAEFLNLQPIGSVTTVTGSALGASVEKSKRSLLQRTQDESASARLMELDHRVDGWEIRGDFQGTVTGKWQGVGPQGEGRVTYKGKTYKTKRAGFSSIPRGYPVELTYANGVYYSSY